MQAAGLLNRTQIEFRLPTLAPEKGARMGTVCQYLRNGSEEYMEKLCGLILFCSLSAAPLAMNGQMINDHPGPAENVGLSIDARV